MRKVEVNNLNGTQRLSTSQNRHTQHPKFGVLAVTYTARSLSIFLREILGGQNLDFTIATKNTTTRCPVTAAS